MPAEDTLPGVVTVSVNDQRQITCTPDQAEPDVNGNLCFTLQSTGSTVWNFKPGNPINISNPQDFSWTLVSPTQLNVTDTSADEATVPQHNYTVMLQSQNGDEAEFDPVIKDRI